MGKIDHISSEQFVANGGESWAEQNKNGRDIAEDLVTEMRVTGDVTLLLGTCRKLGQDAFYSGIGVGFFTYLASHFIE